ncbi:MULTISPECIES: putative T7SS-secreted protein [unclassified Microbacterium]|uniref:putative T7SS-secreted protein n=1 Tax=unclassified Microbacterium TaxID=2609290 RepID=UPI00214C4D45|nr:MULTISPECIES: hypothetical protein [unclassified Microbacterium]MCR2785099.1 hypothetical protein [Microbacterium sp. zg.B96]MDL5352459.1 hypothetical protein [Microbacterium sp. zg-YB36]WIM16632.1 hypothetical protein QNO11_03050 [Microbacterium sp. zg-B96]
MSIELPDRIAPIPGSPDTVSSRATRFTATADAILEAVSGLRAAIADTSQHESKALDQLAENAGQVATRLESLEGRYREAGSALSSFATDLQTAQTEAMTLVREHAEATASEDRYNREIDHYREQRQRTTDPMEAVDLNRHLMLLTQRQGAQSSAAAGAQARFAQIIERLRDSGVAAAGRMRDAMDGDGLNDGLWDNFSGWVAENAEILKAIHKVLQLVTTVLSVLSFFLPVLAPFALAAAALTAGLSLILASTGQISWVDFAIDLITVATFGVAAVATRAIGGVMTALKGTRVARLAAQGNSSALRSVTGSFNGVLRGKNGLSLGPVQLPSVQWVREVTGAKGVFNAHFLRVAESARAGAGGPLDDLLLQIGREEMARIKIAFGIRTAVTMPNTILGSVAPGVADAFERIMADNPVSDVVDAGADWYQGVKDSATWKVGS